MILDEFNQALGQVISEYERGDRTPSRAMEIVSFITSEHKERLLGVNDEQIKMMGSVVADWGTCRIEPADAIERICAIHRTWTAVGSSN
jgi:hypothetical protein